MGNNTFAKRLKTLREAAGLSERDLAKKLFVTRQAVSKWETGKGLPSPDILVNIANIFNVSTDYLLGRIDTPNAVKKEQVIKYIEAEPPLNKEEKDALHAWKVRYLIALIEAPIVVCMFFIGAMYDYISDGVLSIFSYVLFIPIMLLLIGFYPFMIKKYKKLTENNKYRSTKKDGDKDDKDKNSNNKNELKK